VNGAMGRARGRVVTALPGPRSRCALACVDFAREKVERESTGSLAAILVEPMQGTAGNLVPPGEFQSLGAGSREEAPRVVAPPPSAEGGLRIRSWVIGARREAVYVAAARPPTAEPKAASEGWPLALAAFRPRLCFLRGQVDHRSRAAASRFIPSWRDSGAPAGMDRRPGGWHSGLLTFGPRGDARCSRLPTSPRAAWF